MLLGYSPLTRPPHTHTHTQILKMCLHACLINLRITDKKYYSLRMRRDGQLHLKPSLPSCARICLPGNAGLPIHIALGSPLFSRHSILWSAMLYSAWSQPGSQQRKDPMEATSTPRHCWPMLLPWQVTRKKEVKYSSHLKRKQWKKVRAPLKSSSHPAFSVLSRTTLQISPKPTLWDPFPLSALVSLENLGFLNEVKHQKVRGSRLE